MGDESTWYTLTLSALLNAKPSTSIDVELKEGSAVTSLKDFTSRVSEKRESNKIEREREKHDRKRTNVTSIEGNAIGDLVLVDLRQDLAKGLYSLSRKIKDR